ncbi:GxxExxY protein [Opitutales bacterium]|jgi:GxxExxY protein|nr:GxxExxY protein [Opitutales bacterium]MDB2680999.1 GxxExxY protein [Opitutales bacterium]
MNENQIGTIIVDEAVRIHKALGPGILEIVYEAVLVRRLEKRGLVVERQKPVSIEFEEEHFDEGFRADLIMNGLVIIELKSVEKVSPVHKKQLLTYLRLTDLKGGY